MTGDVLVVGRSVASHRIASQSTRMEMGMRGTRDLYFFLEEVF